MAGPGRRCSPDRQRHHGALRRLARGVLEPHGVQQPAQVLVLLDPEPGLLERLARSPGAQADDVGHRHIKLKTYGNHLKGNFEVWIKEKEKEDIISELDLQKNGTTFDFKSFLEQLNDKIPNSIPKEEKIATIRANKGVIGELGIDENDKIILIGTRHLSIGTPQDKTLRKLYVHTDSEVEVIEEFIERLKETNSTVAWTTVDNKKNAPDIRNLINGL